MYYPFLTMEDSTEMVRSERKPDGSIEIYLEKPDAKDCFRHAICVLPSYQWKEVSGFSNDELSKYQQIIADRWNE